MTFSFSHYYAHHRDLHPFPTRRSSDLGSEQCQSAALASRHAKTFLLISLMGPHCQGQSRTASRTSQRRTSEDEGRSEEHTSELQSRLHLVCRLLLEKKKTKPVRHHNRR